VQLADSSTGALRIVSQRDSAPSSSSTSPPWTNQAVRTTAALILRGSGYTVVEAADGRDDLRMLETAPVGMVLLDVEMPGLDGLELLDRLEHPPPVVLATAHAFDADVARRRDKVGGYLRQPVPSSALVAAVARHSRSGPSG